jgi:hypothetical protein
MKKLLLTMTALSSLSVMAMNEETSLIKINVTTQDYSMIIKPEGKIATTIKEALRYDGLRDLDTNNATASVSFIRGTEEDGIFTRGRERFEKLYPYTKEFLEITQWDATHSVPIYELWAKTAELGKIILAEKYVDENNPLEHQTLILSSEDDDTALATKRTVQTFVMVDGTEKVVKTEETSTPYTYTERQDDRWEDAVHDHIWTVRDYVRSDGTVFARDWQDLGLVVKRPPAPPAPAPSPQPVPPTIWNNDDDDCHIL